ncbi:hypothetical protein [Ferrimonas balearica]|uniref:hypothetical protein n=1 Tax=Ferrimonas balearica TaxID=44012 RepID=UPI001C99EB38|nr:hypothetical protein [Ferrimonas balearica]MBY5920420.1 hypothetical protein [Ferrimonas balearica]MBY5996895.1 hypothetical protein [Ferrimonas balearica]
MPTVTPAPVVPAPPPEPTPNSWGDIQGKPLLAAVKVFASGNAQMAGDIVKSVSKRSDGDYTIELHGNRENCVVVATGYHQVSVYAATYWEPPLEHTVFEISTMGSNGMPQDSEFSILFMEAF